MSVHHRLAGCFWFPLFTVASLVFPGSVVGQVGQPNGVAAVKSTDYLATAAASVQPEYPGGDEALIQFLSKSLRYPVAAFNEGAEGRVTVSFWVDEQGQTYGFGVIATPHPALAEEALRVMRTMPLWTPGQRNGQPAPMVVHVPIVFRRPTGG